MSHVNVKSGLFIESIKVLIRARGSSAKQTCVRKLGIYCLSVVRYNRDIILLLGGCLLGYGDSLITTSHNG